MHAAFYLSLILTVAMVLIPAPQADAQQPTSDFTAIETAVKMAKAMGIDGIRLLEIDRSLAKLPIDSSQRQRLIKERNLLKEIIAARSAAFDASKADWQVQKLHSNPRSASVTQTKETPEPDWQAAFADVDFKKKLTQAIAAQRQLESSVNQQQPITAHSDDGSHKPQASLIVPAYHETVLPIVPPVETRRVLPPWCPNCRRRHF